MGRAQGKGQPSGGYDGRRHQIGSRAWPGSTPRNWRGLPIGAGTCLRGWGLASRLGRGLSSWAGPLVGGVSMSGRDLPGAEGPRSSSKTGGVSQSERVCSRACCLARARLLKVWVSQPGRPRRQVGGVSPARAQPDFGGRSVGSSLWEQCWELDFPATSSPGTPSHAPLLGLPRSACARWFRFGTWVVWR